MEPVLYSNAALASGIGMVLMLCLCASCRRANDVAQSTSNPPAAQQVAGKQTSGSGMYAGVTRVRADIDNGHVKCLPATGAQAEVSWTVVSKLGAKAEDMEITVRQERGELIVENHWHGFKLGPRPDVNVEIKAPAASGADLNVGNGSVEYGLKGQLELSVGNGNIKLDGEPTSSEVSLGNGDVNGAMLLSAGKHEITLGNGTVNLALRPGSSCKLTADTGVGKISAGGIDGSHSGAFVSDKFSGSLGDGKASLDVTLGNGSIALKAEK